MSCNTTDDVRIIMKYSTISGATPSIPLSDNHEDGTWIPTDLYIGEFFTNAADDTFWIRTDNGISQLFGGTGGTGSFIGDFVNISGGTFSGLVFAPTFSANYLVGGTVSGDTITADYFIGGTYSGDGSLLTGIVANWLGGTVSDGVYFTNEAKFTNDTWLDGNVYSTSGINISGSVSVSGGILTSDYFVGDGSGLTNLPTGTYSDIYTTGATLSGDTIIFTRNDSNTYDIDLTPILNQQSITTMTWDSSTDELLTTFNDASTIGLTIDSFAQVSSTGPITSPEFYGGIFYGEFVGTYSNDIYTISGTLSGTDEIFTRTDGSTFSVDLSSLAGGGGGTQSLEQTLAIGNTTGTYSIVVDNSSEIIFGTSSGLLFNNTSRLREGTIDAGYGGNKGIAQICAVGYEMKWESGSLYIMNGDGTEIREVRYTFGATPSTSDDVTKGFTIGSRWVLDNGNLYTCSDTSTASAVWDLEATGVGNLEQTLTIGDTTGANWINVNSGYGLLSTDGTGTSSQTFTPLLIELEATGTSSNTSRIELEANSLNLVSTDNINTSGISIGLGTSVVSTVTDGTGIVYTNMSANDYNISSSDGTDTSTQTHTANSIISTAADVALNITDTITLDPQGSINDTGIKSEDSITLDYTQTIHTPTDINLNNVSTTNDRDMSFDITGIAINTNVNETSTGFYSSTQQRNYLIEAYVQDVDFLFSETKNAYQYFTKVDNQTLDINSTFTQIEDSILMNVTDNGYGYFSSKEIKPNQHQTQFSLQGNIFTIEDKRAGWMQTSDDTTALMIYCDMDPTGSTSSIVQIKAHVRGISSDKMLGYAAEITSWVRVNPAEPYPVTQIGVVDYIIKSEFTTAHSSFVVSGPNMYIDVTGEIGITIDWTCNVELLYDKNTF